MDWLVIGKIVGVQGLRGEVRVYPDSDFPERFLEPGERWLLRPQQTEPEPVQLVAGRYLDGKGLYVLKLQGIDDRATAEALRNGQILVPESDRLPLQEGEFHVLDLVNLEVFDQTTQEPIGVVTDVMTAGNDLLEVKLHQPKGGPTTILVPFVMAIVPVVDLENRRIEITPPKGLLP